MPIMQEGRGKRMPFLFLSPSTQYFNPYVTTGDERYWMNALADEMMPYLHASGITVTRNDPDGSAAQSIRDSNASRQDFHLALHSNAAPQALAGQLRGVDFYYYPTSEAGLRMANILVDNMKTIYPLPDRVQARPSTIIGEIRRTRVPAVLAEIGYHDNEDDANWLTGNLDAVARTLSLGVTEYFGVPFLTPGDEFEAEAAGAVPPVPERVFAKPPSAELSPNQEDEKSMGIDYPTLDALLQAHVERGLGADALVAEGFDAAQVERVLSTVRATAFKRALEPPYPQAPFYA